MSNARLKIISSYNKCFSDADFSAYSEISRANVLKDDVFSLEALFLSETNAEISLFCDGKLAKYSKIYEIRDVFVKMPAYRDRYDDDYLNNRQPGMYPDLMIPLSENDKVFVNAGVLKSFWIEVSIPENAISETSVITVGVKDKDENILFENKLEIEVIGAVLPKQELIYTNWFHCDCLSSYYAIDVFIEKHWQIIENFAKTAADSGMNMILTPVFTPPLDTEVGGERPTVQLVGVKKLGDTYEFDYTLCDRWFEMCKRLGIEYFEISHLFTQWGAEHAPKIIADVNGEKKQIFGWNTDSLSDEYIGFVRQFIVSFKEYLKSKDLLKKTMFHISDEPIKEHLPRFLKIREKLSDVLSDCMCGDALSEYEFMSSGAVSTPIPGTNSIVPFIQNKVPDLWCYYCCSQNTAVSNRFVAMSMNRTRVLGTQLFKYDIVGFLQWGYNFYYSQYSKHIIDPYTCNDGGGWVPAGDAFSVYPAPDGTAYPTLHIKSFTQGLYDLRAFRLLESLSSKEHAVKFIEDFANYNITFSDYPRQDDFCEKLRFAVNKKIADLISK